MAAPELIAGTPQQPRPPASAGTHKPACDGGNRNVTDNFLHALVATLSTGPVGFSDALGYTNASLVKSTCDSSGLLLKPTLPLAAIDRTWAASSTVVQVPAGSFVWATHTAVRSSSSSSNTPGGGSRIANGSRSNGRGGNNGNALVWYMVLAISVAEDWSLVRADMYPTLSPAQDVVVWDFVQGPQSAKLVAANTADLASLQSTSGGRVEGMDFAYKLVAPVLAETGGWAVLGEPNKLTPVSEQRNWQFEAGGIGLDKAAAAASASSSLTVKITNRDAVGETVMVAAWKDGKVYEMTAQIDGNGEGVFVFHANVGSAGGG